MSENENCIFFHIPDYEDGKEPLVQLGPKDEIYVRGKLIEHDEELVEGLRAFLQGVIDERLERYAKFVIMTSKNPVKA